MQLQLFELLRGPIDAIWRHRHQEPRILFVFAPAMMVCSSLGGPMAIYVPTHLLILHHLLWELVYNVRIGTVIAECSVANDELAICRLHLWQLKIASLYQVWHHVVGLSAYSIVYDVRP